MIATIATTLIALSISQAEPAFPRGLKPGDSIATVRKAYPGLKFDESIGPKIKWYAPPPKIQIFGETAGFSAAFLNGRLVRAYFFFPSKVFSPLSSTRAYDALVEKYGEPTSTEVINKDSVEEKWWWNADVEILLSRSKDGFVALHYFNSPLSASYTEALKQAEQNEF